MITKRDGIIVNEDDYILYPSYPIMHCGGTENSVDYPLSKVLGSWGYTIREIHINEVGEAEVLCYTGKDGERTASAQLLIPSNSRIDFKLPVRSHFLDLILRYDYKAPGVLSAPKWAKAWHMCFALADLDTQKYYEIPYSVTE